MSTTIEQQPITATVRNEQPVTASNPVASGDIERRTGTEPRVSAPEENKEGKDKTPAEKEKEKNKLENQQNMAMAKEEQLENARKAAKTRMDQLLSDLFKGKKPEQSFQMFIQLFILYIALNRTSRSLTQIQAQVAAFEDQIMNLAKANNVEIPAEAGKEIGQPTGTNSPVIEGLTTGNMTETAMPSVASAPETNGAT